MLNISAAQLDALLLAWLYPGARIFGMIAAAPLFNNLALPRLTRIALGLALTAAIVPVIPPAQGVLPGTWNGIGVFALQMLIGVGIGFAMRVMFAAVDVAGEIIGLQMGLSFATFFDPQSAGQTSVIAEFIGLMTSLIFLALNGHLLMIDVMAQSFELLPIAQPGLAGKGWLVLVQAAAVMFAAGLLMAIPIVAALLITNLALATLTRAAPQLNLFAVGFPITSTIGMLLIIVSLEAMAPVIQNLFEHGYSAIWQLLRVLSAA